jgi:hypothetical protein
MEGRTWTLAGLVVTALGIAFVLTPRYAAAFHTVFDARVERFSVDGNAFGPLDGQALVGGGVTASASTTTTTFVLGGATAGAAGRCATAQSTCAPRGTKRRCS